MMRVDRVFINGKIITMDTSFANDSSYDYTAAKMAEGGVGRCVEALAVQGEHITAIGTNSEIKGLVDSRTEVINLKGHTVIPAFNDAHCHLLLHADFMDQIDCGTPPCRSIEDIKEKIAWEVRKVKPHRWVRGFGYYDTKLIEKRHPTRWDLDEVAPANPVCLVRQCGHIVVANSRALHLAKINRETPHPPGGVIQRDESGEPTGVLLETARDLVMKKIPENTSGEIAYQLKRAQMHFLRFGVASLHDMKVEEGNQLKAFQEFYQSGSQRVRMNLMLRKNIWENLVRGGLMGGIGDHWMRIGGVKIFLDGGASGRTAALRQPYAGDGAERGILWMQQEELNREIQAVHSSGYSIGVHALGDQAVENVLEAFSKAFSSRPGKNLRHRIEHGGILDDELIRQIRSLRLWVVPQPIFVYLSGEAYRKNIGEAREEQAFPLRDLLRNRVAVACSSDCPISNGSPFLGLYSAVNRLTEEGNPFGTRQKISIEKALPLFTLTPAFLSGEEGIKGTLSIGKLADMAILSADPLLVEPQNLKEITAVMTVVGGRIQWAAKDTPVG